MRTLARFLLPLVSEDGGKSASLGRLAFWIVFAICCHHWWFGVAVASSMEVFGLSLLGYNIGKKGLFYAYKAKTTAPPKRADSPPEVREYDLKMDE